MTSLLKYCLVILIFTVNRSDRVDALTKKYASLITDAHKYYGTSSVFFTFSRYKRLLQEHTLENSVCREFSRNGVYTLMINLDRLNNVIQFYEGRIVRPLIVVTLKSLNDIAEFNERIQHMNKAYPIWLVIFASGFSKTLCEYCNRPMGNIFNLQFDTQMLVVCCDNPMLKEWWSIHTNRTKIAAFATWTKKDGMTLLAKRGLYNRRHDVDGAGIRIAIVTTSSLVHDYGQKIGGFCGALLQEIKQSMNFTISEIIRDKQFGSWISTTEGWSGVIGRVAQGSADLGVAEFSMTNYRRHVVDFTLPMLITRNRLYIRAPDGSEVRWSSYFEVFEMDIWMSILVLMMTTPILLALMKMKRGSISLSCLITENYLDVWGIFCQEGVSQFPAETPMRIAYVSIFISSVVVSAAYSASLISFLTVSSISLPFSTMAGFANDKSYKLITVKNSSDFDVFANTSDPGHKKIMKLMKPWEELPETPEEGFDQVCNGRVAFFADDVVKKTVADRINCKLAEVNTGRADNLAMILSTKSQYTGVVNYHLLRILDNGMLQRLKQRYFLKANTTKSTHSVVGFWGIVPILSVLAGGIIIGLFVMFCEKQYHSKRISL